LVHPSRRFSCSHFTISNLFSAEASSIVAIVHPSLLFECKHCSICCCTFPSHQWYILRVGSQVATRLPLIRVLLI
jgi:hypothetical protein